MKEVQDRVVQFSNRYKLTDVATGKVLGTFDFDEVTGTVQQVGTEIDAELFQSIADDLAARVKLSGGELAGTIVTFSDIGGTAANVASGDTSATLWGKVKNWFSRLKALAFKNKVAAGDFEAGAIKNADVAADAAIAQSKVSGLMTDYVASISVSGRTVTYKNKNGVNMGSITTQDTTYELASQSSNGLMSSTDKTKLDGIESGAQKNTVLGVKGGSESAYRTGNVNITKANIGLDNVDNTSDKDKPLSAATQTALNGKANTSGTYPNLTVGKATNADKATNAANAENANNAASANKVANALTVVVDGESTVYDGSAARTVDINTTSSTDPEAVHFTEQALTSKQQTQARENIGAAGTSGNYPNMTVGNATNAQNATKATQDASGNVITATYATKTENNAKYTKPSTGIPKGDLASAVQTSLNKADTALQSIPIATQSAVGGVKPTAKTSEMTQPVGVDSNGALWTKEASEGWGIEYAEELPAASETSPAFVQTPDGVLYRKKATKKAPEGGSLLGTWVFKDELVNNIGKNRQEYYNITFLCPSAFSGDCDEMHVVFSRFEGVESVAYYDNDIADLMGRSKIVYSIANENLWDKEGYKTIQITDTSALTNKAEFATWLKANATQTSVGGASVTYSYIALADA